MTLENNYITIADWMLELKLNTRELLVFALVYGFCQDGSSYFGSLSYLAAWLGISDRSNATRYLNSLVKKGLLKKECGISKVGQKVCAYTTTINKGKISEMYDVDYINIQPWMLRELKLSGKDLLVYALVHKFSRRGSDNVCFYNRKYFSKWLQCRSDHVNRQIQRVIKMGLLKYEGDDLVAIVPKKFQKNEFVQVKDKIDFAQIDNTYTQIDNTTTHFDYTITQSDKTLTQIDNIYRPKLTTNNRENKNNIQTFTIEQLYDFINQDINLEDLDETEKVIMETKRVDDYKKYQTHLKIDVPVILKSWALRKLRILSAYKNRETIYRHICKTEDLILDVLNKNFSNLSLNEKEYEELFRKIYEISKEDGIKDLRAYLVGMVNNIKK